jgi:hypothetical protein
MVSGLADSFSRQRVGLVAATALVALVALVALWGLSASSAHASGCTDSWTNTAGGNWSTGTNWSTGSPPEAEEEACIVATGTYTVTLSEPGATLAFRSLTIGGASGQQTLAVDANTTFAGATALLEPHGLIAMAAGTQLTVGVGDALINEGTIEAAGSGAVVVQGEPLTPATFTEGTGSITGSRPVIVDDGTLNYTGTEAAHGSGPITMRGRGTITGKVRQGESLTVESVCGQEAEVDAAGTAIGEDELVFSNGGTVELTSDSCARNIFFTLGKEFTELFKNYGLLKIDNPDVAFFQIQGCRALINYGTVELDPTPLSDERRQGPSLQLQNTCRYNQEPKGRLRTLIASASDYGRILVGDGGRLEGELDVRTLAPFAPAPEELFTVIGGSSNGLEHEFDVETEHPVDYTGLYYKPTYSSFGQFKLKVTQVTEARTPTKGAPGTLATVSGSGYAEAGHLGEVTLTFTDHEGVQTVYPNVFLGEGGKLKAGEFSTQIEVPATAALGMGKVTVTSPQDDVHISKSFNVT